MTPLMCSQLIASTTHALAILAVAPLTPWHVSVAQDEWGAYGADNRNTKYSALSGIDAENVNDLHVAWRWSSPDNEIVKGHPRLHLNLFEGTPVIFEGNLYVATGLNQAASIDARSGRTRWVFDPRIYERGIPQRTGFIHRGLTLWPEGRRVFLATGDGYLHALDVASGKPVPEFGERGSIDLLREFRRSAERFQVGVNSPPILIGDVLVVGSFVQDGWRNKLGPPGDVHGYSARNGKLLWTFRTVPERDDVGVETWLDDSWKYSGSTNVWTVMSADVDLGYVYLPTSTPTNDHYGGHRLGDNLFAESIVCLDAKTGKRVWHFQTTHHGVWDYDLPAAPVLADVTVDGKPRKVLAQSSKQAFLYVLDRETGAPIWPIDERAVPQSTVPGEHSSPTQPFPTRPAAFDRQGITEVDLIDFTPELRREAAQILRKFDFGMLYTPPSERGAIALPGNVGGASWAGGALDPESGWFYVTSVTRPAVYRVARPETGSSDMNFLSLGSDRFFVTGPDDLPITKPPYGRITAIDLNSGEHKWMVPLGNGPRDHLRLKGLNLPPLGWPSRGFVLVTKTLLFAVQEPAITRSDVSHVTNTMEFKATTREPQLSAFDKRTGQLISTTVLPANAGGSPMTYSLGSQQFVVVPVGGGGVPAELVALAVSDP